MRCSVLMSVYNGSIPQLREAVDSILQQEFGPFELILCDDGSEEPVRSWLETLQEDSRVRLLRNRKNRGLAGSNPAMGRGPSSRSSASHRSMNPPHSA